jgi:predicted  nucleic acid-binding Zn-ribbon protein
MHKCVRCGASYEDSDANIIRGCQSCGSIFFLYTNGPSDANVRQLDAVKEELRSKDTTIENELAKEIDRRKSEDQMEHSEAEARGATSEEIAEKLVEWEGESTRLDGVETIGPRSSVKKVSDRLKTKAGGKPRKPVISKAKEKEKVIIGDRKFALEDLFGIETVRVKKAGVYEINIDALMKKRPVIVLEKGGIYIIHLPQAFESQNIDGSNPKPKPK